VSGHKFFTEGRVCFTPAPLGEALDGFYATVFMPVVHNGEVYGKCDHNLSLALTRLTARRLWEGEGSRPHYHEQLCDNQRAYLDKHQGFFESLGSVYSEHDGFSDYFDSSQECREHYADPHQKKQLRIAGFLDLEAACKVEDFNSNWLRGHIDAKMKTGEIAKFGKIPRMIFDLGVEASLLGFRLTSCLKEAMSDYTFEINGGHVCFCKTPNPFALQDAFDQLIAPRGRFFFLFFSDDSCLSIRLLDGRVLRYNLDISSCDSSHTEAIFRTWVLLFPERLRPEALRLVDQCKAKFKVKSHSDPRECVVIKPVVPKLYSGSTITTVINNTACIALIHRISAIPESLWSSVAIVDACEDVGYKVTGTEPLECVEDIQFLKNSPVLDIHGHYRPLLNLGPFFRASGRAKGDIPGRGDIVSRAYRFQKGLMMGAYPRANIPFLSKLYRRLPGDAFPCDYFTSKVESDANYPTWVVDEESLFTRYRLLAFEVADLHYWAENVHFGDHFSCSAFNKILEVDYGLTGCDVDQRSYLRRPL